jgi:hypothetical protein
VKNYDIYLRSIHEMAASLSLPIVPMTREEFARAEIEANYVHQSVIDMDAFEAAFSQ